MISIFASEWDAENKDWKIKELSSFSKFKNLIKNILGIPSSFKKNLLHKDLINFYQIILQFLHQKNQKLLWLQSVC